MDRSPRPILLTGAPAYVGAHLLRALTEREDEVRALPRDPGRASLPEGPSAGLEFERHLVDHLLPMIAPRRVDAHTRPVAIAGAVGVGRPRRARRPLAEGQPGGAGVPTHREMMARYASLPGRRRGPLIRVPHLMPELGPVQRPHPMGNDAAIGAAP